MSSTPSLGKPDTLTPEQTLRVQKHLEEILASHAFAGSRRTQAFLRLIVTHALEGDLDNLRERMIGAELFGRPVSYDTGNDSVVRVRASEVRKKLAAYYSELGSRPLPVRFELPSGSYVPRFHFEAASDGAFASHPAPIQEHTDDEITPPHPAHSHPPTTLHSPRRMRLLSLITAILLAFLLLVTAGVVVWIRKKPAGAYQNAGAYRSIHSIAILPLENLSAAPAQEYFADGVTEELINDLGQVSNLRVISLTSSMSYKGTHKSLPEIAQKLAVDGVLEGGILRDDKQVRISVQLIDAATDRPIWAHTYVRDLTNVPSWQGEVAQTIAEQISIQLTPQQHARLSHEPAVNPQAQDLYLHGLLLREDDHCTQAIGFFNHAIELSPNYAQAHSALASCYGRLGESGRLPYKIAFMQQKEEALKAISLDDSLSEAHAELANTDMTLDWDWQAADTEFRRALELNPNSATTHEKYAFYLVRTGHSQEALNEIAAAVALDPVASSTFHAEGFVDYFSRQYRRALDAAQTVRGLKLNLPDWYFLMGDIDAAQGLDAQAIEAFQKSGNGPYSLGHLASVQARIGRANQARLILAQLRATVEKDGIGSYEIALIYTALSDKNNAFRWLEKAYQAHDVGLVYLKVDPSLDPLRSDPRFADLMQRVGLTP